MMTKYQIVTPFVPLLLLLPLTISCSDHESVPKCEETTITIRIDGELQTFEPISRGISLTSNGYELVLGFFRRIESPLVEQNILITLPYKKTGKKIIENLFYTQYKNSIYFEGNILNDDLESDVTKNTNACFSTTFTGKLNDGIQDIIIESVQISYQYEEPFDD